MVVIFYWFILCWKNRSALRGLVRKYEGKRMLGTLRHRWEENIKADFKDLVWKVVNKWLGLEEAINLWVS
jgi:hypothetical protein